MFSFIEKYLPIDKVYQGHEQKRYFSNLNHDSNGDGKNV